MSSQQVFIVQSTPENVQAGIALTLLLVLMFGGILWGLWRAFANPPQDNNRDDEN